MKDRKEYKATWYKQNKERILKIHKEWYENNKEVCKEQRASYMKSYQNTPKGKYASQKAHAKTRGVEWAITFEEWLSFWKASGKWEERSSGKYMMCRTNDSGPYKIGNVRIDTATSNIRERFRLKKEMNEN